MTVLSRRLLLNACLTVPFGSKLLAGPAHAIDTAVPSSDVSAPGFRTIGSDSCSYRVPSVWQAPTLQAPSGAPGPWVDTVNGPVAEFISATTASTSLKSLDELGDISLVKLSKLGFDDLARADLVAAVRRQGGDGAGKDGTPYFDYDLALSPATCERDQMILPGSCLPTRVVLLSCSVRDGTLHTLRIDVNPSQWRLAGTTLRNVRNSFTVV
jgi:hypothetical protein